MPETQLQQAEERLAQRVPDFYRGRCVLLTGGSGFVGRVLLEKLLRSCPDVDTVFLLLRTRKGVPPHERLKAFTDVPLFDRLRAERPGALGKAQVVSCNMLLPGLGLSETDAQLLRERVSVVFHLAASVRFDDPLQVALHVNTRSTRSILELAAHMPQLQAFVHVSTTFCNVGQEVYEEKLYPPPADGRILLEVVESLDPHHLRVLTSKILGEHCNTYTFSKNLAEHAVKEYADRLPAGIVRLSVVVPTSEDPFPGWIDNFNGPMGLMVGAGKGVVHVGYSGPDKFIDYVPCDISVKGLIISSCEIAKKGVGELSVYQGAQSDLERITQSELIQMGNDMAEVLPFKETLYYTCGGVTSSRLLFYVQFLFFQLLPAAMVDTWLTATGRKPMLVRLQRRIFLANMALAWFTMQNWNFVNERFLELERKLADGDYTDFGYNLHLISSQEFFLNALRGTRRYLLNESDEDLPLAKRRHWRNRIVHLILKTLLYSSVTWILLSRLIKAFSRTDADS